jgi:hypothetical protein
MSGYPKGFYSVLMIVSVALLASGILLVPTLLAMRLEIDVPWRLETDQRTITAAIHLIAAFAVLAAAGALWAVHMQRGWRMKRNRITGSLLVSTLAVLGLTGAGVYYFGDEGLSKWSSLVHTAAGLAVVLIMSWHMTHGNKRVK